jgi:hypothetical protein
LPQPLRRADSSWPFLPADLPRLLAVRLPQQLRALRVQKCRLAEQSRLPVSPERPQRVAEQELTPPRAGDLPQYLRAERPRRRERLELALLLEAHRP